ncbi:MAG: type II toxin-antitoxin system RelE/ParE family toxin [Nanoarchaeota archaeon]
MSFTLDYDNQPRRFLKKQDKHISERIIDKIEETLKENPVPHNSKSIINQHNCFRIRIGDCRVLYRINYQDKKIIFSR